MILAVDIGNSNTVVGLFNDEGQLSFRSSLGTDQDKTRDQCAVELLGVFRLYRAECETISGAILSSVVPPLTSIMAEAVELLIGRRPLVVGSGLKTGLNIRGEIHSQLGSDIVAESVAAIDKYPSPVVVVDMGTATTISLVRERVYEGCIIMPGADLSVEALWSRAAALPPISLETSPAAELLGRTTEAAMRSGVLYGHASMVDGILTRVEELLQEKPFVVATGDNAARYLSNCRHAITVDQDLVMRGLYLLYQKNTFRRRRANPT